MHVPFTYGNLKANQKDGSRYGGSGGTEVGDRFKEVKDWKSVTGIGLIFSSPPPILLVIF